MKVIKTATLAILMTFAGIPAWGMDYFNALTNMAAPFLPVLASAYIFTAKPTFNLKFCNYMIRHDIPEGQVGRNLRGEGHYMHNGTLLGVIVFSRPSNISEIEINTLLVDRPFRSCGIGSALLHEFEKEQAAQCPSSSCEINLYSTKEAIPFYEKNGFTCDKNRYCTKEFLSTMHDLKKGSRI